MSLAERVKIGETSVYRGSEMNFEIKFEKIKIGLSVWEGVNTFDISRSWIGPFLTF